MVWSGYGGCLWSWNTRGKILFQNEDSHALLTSNSGRYEKCSRVCWPQKIPWNVWLNPRGGGFWSLGCLRLWDGSGAPHLGIRNILGSEGRTCVSWCPLMLSDHCSVAFMVLLTLYKLEFFQSFSTSSVSLQSLPTHSFNVAALFLPSASPFQPMPLLWVTLIPI